MQTLRLLLLVVGLGFFAGCTTVKQEHALPDQRLGSSPAPGTRRIVFYNDTSVAAYPTSHRIGIKLNGKGVGAPYSGEYVQVDLPSGEHTLELSHFDVVYYHDKYRVKVAAEDLYFRIYCTLIATKFDVTPEKPAILPMTFKPMTLDPK